MVKCANNMHILSVCQRNIRPVSRASAQSFDFDNAKEVAAQKTKGGYLYTLHCACLQVLSKDIQIDSVFAPRADMHRTSAMC